MGSITKWRLNQGAQSKVANFIDPRLFQSAGSAWPACSWCLSARCRSCPPAADRGLDACLDQSLVETSRITRSQLALRGCSPLSIKSTRARSRPCRAPTAWSPKWSRLPEAGIDFMLLQRRWMIDRLNFAAKEAGADQTDKSD